MRIAIVQSGLSAGGAEKIVNLLALHRTSLGDEVHVLAFTGTRETSYFEYKPEVSISTLNENTEGKETPYLRVGKRVKWLRGRIQAIRPDLVVSFLTKTNVITLVANLGLGIPVIISERNNPYRQEASIFWRNAIGLLQPIAAVTVMQTQAAKNHLSKRMQAKSIVIPNPNTMSSAFARERRAKKSIVATGRLSYQKGFDLLLQAFAIVAPQTASVRLTIFGEGPDRAKLMEQSRNLGISNRVSFPGITRKPGEWLRGADIFVLSSRYEGFPNVLVEAVAAGLPSIAFACPWGPSDILTHEKDGLLVEPENVAALASGILRLLHDDKLRLSLSKASTGVAGRFELAKVMSQWDDAIKRACQSNH